MIASTMVSFRPLIAALKTPFFVKRIFSGNGSVADKIFGVLFLTRYFGVSDPILSALFIAELLSSCSPIAAEKKTINARKLIGIKFHYINIAYLSYNLH